MIFVSSTIFFILLTAFFFFKKKAKDRKDLLLITVIFFISLIFFFPLFLGNYFSPSDMLFSYAPWKGAFGYKSASNPLLGDLTFQVYPWNHFLKYSIEKHIIPLWNPFTSCGAPFFANGSSSVFFALIRAFLRSTTAAPNAAQNSTVASPSVSQARKSSSTAVTRFGAPVCARPVCR